MKRFRLIPGLMFALAPTLLSAGQIGIDDFTAAAVVQDFEGLGIGSNRHPSVLVVGADTFETHDDDHLRSSSKFGPIIGRSRVALTNSPGSSNAPVGFIDIVLGNPAFRAGLYVGSEFPWAFDVEFLGAQDELLSSLAFSGNGRDNDFAAWQADAGLVSRIRVNDRFNDDSHPIIIDDFIQEVPEPGSLLLLSLGAIGGLGFRQRRSRSPISASL